MNVVMHAERCIKEQVQKCIEYSFIYVPEYREHYGICSGELQTTVTATVGCTLEIENVAGYTYCT